MASKTADTVKLVLRLPKPLHRRLTAEARRKNVSLNTEIINQLAGYEARITYIIDKTARTASALAAENVVQRFNLVKPKE
jgi:hypothetical protein